MLVKTLYSGLLGGLVIIVWTFLVNGIFGFQARIDFNRIPNEKQVYQTLKEQIVEPGRYIFNPELTPEMRFPDGEPVFSVLYGGIGHEAAGFNMLLGLASFIIAPIIGAWMLSQTSRKFKSSYPKKSSFSPQ